MRTASALSGGVRRGALAESLKRRRTPPEKGDKSLSANREGTQLLSSLSEPPLCSLAAGANTPLRVLPTVRKQTPVAHTVSSTVRSSVAGSVVRHVFAGVAQRVRETLSLPGACPASGSQAELGHTPARLNGGGTPLVTLFPLLCRCRCGWFQSLRVVPRTGTLREPCRGLLFSAQTCRLH